MGRSRTGIYFKQLNTNKDKSKKESKRTLCTPFPANLKLMGKVDNLYAIITIK